MTLENKNSNYSFLKRLISLRKLMILLTDETLKSSFTVFALKYFVRI